MLVQNTMLVSELIGLIAICDRLLTINGIMLNRYYASRSLSICLSFKFEGRIDLQGDLCNLLRHDSSPAT
jgi:hypothetical protein